MNASFERRGELFRESYDYIRRMSEDGPFVRNAFGELSDGIDMLPKPTADRLPLLVTGSSQQDSDWIAHNADGWMTYPRPTAQQAHLIDAYRDRINAAGLTDKPVMEPLYLDLASNPNEGASPIHLGFRMGINTLSEYLQTRHAIGVNHVALNLRFNQARAEQTMEQLADKFL